MATNAAQLRAEANLALDEAVALSLESREARIRGDLATAQQLNAQAQQKLAQGQALNKQAELAENSPGIASSGQVVNEEAQARAEGAASSNPTPPASVLAPSGRINRDNIESGTDDPVRTQENTQSTPPAGEGSVLSYSAPGDEDAAQTPFVTTQGGAAANRDDNTRPNNNTASQIINASFNQRIRPRANVLDEYASYTYAVTWYLLTPDQYNEMVRSKKKNCSTWQLLMQSGGAPTQVAGTTGGTPNVAGRNNFFQQDYYIDDLEIESIIPLKGTGAANTATNIKFKVTEPNGITLIENLYKAVSTLYKQKNVNKNANYPMAQYCLVVRFYGYNDAGELITPGRRGTNGQTNLTDPRAIVEKFYPFVITNIKFRIPRDRVVEYQVEAKPIPHFYNKSQDRGSIPFNFELVGETVEQVLQGKPVGTLYTPVQEGRVDSQSPNTSAPTAAPILDNVSSSLGEGA